MKIFLDDERIPVQTGWRIARTSGDFTTLLLDNSAIVEEVSFDHDLGENSQSGMSCLRYLIDAFMDFPSGLPKLTRVTFHSANPTGCENMLAYAVNASEHIDALRNIEFVVRSCLYHRDHARMPDDFDYDGRES